MNQLDLLGAVVDVVAMPLTSTADCARDIAAAPVYEAQRRLQVQKSIAGVRVNAEDRDTIEKARATQQAKVDTQVASLGNPAVLPGGSNTKASPPAEVGSQTGDPCQYRTMCVGASTLLVITDRGGASGKTEHPQYSLKNSCGDTIDCYICGTRGGSIVRDDDGQCDDSNHYSLETDETWILDGRVQAVDGMTLTCLHHDGSEHPSCRTWPQ